MARRSKMEINLDILRVVSRGKHKPTHIMYKANLSWKRLKNHLKFLEGQNLLTKIQKGEGARYEITARGVEVLNYFRKIEGVIYPSKKSLLSKASIFM